MRTEREKMLAGELYDPLDPGLVERRARARDLCQNLNATREAEVETRRGILRELFGSGGDTVWMQPPFSPWTSGPTSGWVGAPSSCRACQSARVR